MVGLPPPSAPFLANNFFRLATVLFSVPNLVTLFDIDGVSAFNAKPAKGASGSHGHGRRGAHDAMEMGESQAGVQPGHGHY